MDTMVMHHPRIIIMLLLRHRADGLPRHLHLCTVEATAAVASVATMLPTAVMEAALERAPSVVVALWADRTIRICVIIRRCWVQLLPDAADLLPVAWAAWDHGAANPLHPNTINTTNNSKYRSSTTNTKNLLFLDLP